MKRDLSVQERRMTLKFLMGALTLSFILSTTSFAEPDEAPESPFPTTSTEAKIYKFSSSGAGADSKPTGTLKLTEQKTGVLLVFEGTGLKKGNYKIIKVSSCEAVRKSLLSKKSPPASDELFSFDTDFGEISTEKRLSAQKIEELELDSKSIALIKIEKKGDILFSCAP
jgi:hypothetical protein